MSTLENKTTYLLLMLFCYLMIPTVYSSEIKPVTNGFEEMTRFEQMTERTWLTKPITWGNDDTIATGPVSGGISATYDASGNMYAARCSTYNDTAQHAVIIYKSTDDGYTWQPFKFFISAGVYNFSYPQLLVCQKADSNFLYLFYWRSDLNGRVRLARWKLDGTLTGYYDVVNGSGSDTITYYSVCSNLDGDTIIVVYQTDSPGDPNPNLAAIVSADYGVNWSIISPGLSGAGAHPDLAYGNEGYVYLAYLRTDYDDIGFLRSTNNGYNWSGFERLTNDGNSHHDDYPKVAALHTAPKDTACVWVVYNHDEPPSAKVTNTDLRFAYSTNSGNNWTEDQVIANDPSASEMAADLKVYRSSNNKYVDLCYLKYSDIVKSGSDIYYTWAEAKSPEQFSSPHQIINEHLANWSLDGREVCQLTYPVFNDYPGIVYAGVSLKKDDGKNLGFGGWNLYYDYHDWVGVEEETEEEKLPAEISLSNNYPNPFNPETKIGYFIPKTCQVKLEIFNILGQRVRTLVDEVQTAGKKEVTWNGKDENGNEIGSGVYFYKLQAGDFAQAKKMVLMK